MKKFLVILSIITLVVLALAGMKFERARTYAPRVPDAGLVDTRLGLRRVEREKRWALIGPDGAAKTAFEFNIIEPFHEGRAVAIKGGKYGFLDTGGRAAIPFKYDIAFGFKDGLAMVGKKGKWGLVDIEGREVISPNYYDVITGFDADGLARAENWKKAERALVNRRGQVVGRLK
ncbi:MAG: WG repeat-containing protein [Rickettsiales bacterium]|jgi:hypothetical protein|nr:WG repeat-containing protein [Rickettsiales bacterium]